MQKRIETDDVTSNEMLHNLFTELKAGLDSEWDGWRRAAARMVDMTCISTELIHCDRIQRGKIAGCVDA